MQLTIHPLTPDRWPDLEAIFNARSCSVARGCWCMCYRRSGPVQAAPGQLHAEVNKAQFKAVVDAGPPPGLIAYRVDPGADDGGDAPDTTGAYTRRGTPVGWLSVGPREHYAKLARSSVMKPVDKLPVWSVICFVVPAEHRGQGIARALLNAAVHWAAQQGATLLEAYPIDKPGPTHPDNLWFGTKGMFDAAGFTEVARRKPERPVVRIKPVA
jgi:GNAT superfamily N-acetyltransferase